MRAQAYSAPTAFQVPEEMAEQDEEGAAPVGGKLFELSMTGEISASPVGALPMLVPL